MEEQIPDGKISRMIHFGERMAIFGNDSMGG